MSNFALPTQFRVKEITIDGEDITPLFISLEIFENIFIPAVSGNISFMDTDGAGFVEEKKIEFNEPFEFQITNAQDETLKFKGVLNGLQNESSKGGKKIYAVDFTTKEMRNNEKMFISERISSSPQEIINDMIQRIQGKINSTGAGGEKLEMVAPRWKPLKVINYVLQRGLSGDSKATKTENGEPTDEKAEGTTGFLCWQTIGESENEYRFCTVDELLKGAFETHSDFENKLMNRSVPIDECMKDIVQYDFTQVGDIQTKMKSGAFRNITVSFDMDTGEYKEYEFDGSQEKNLMTDKQKEIV